ncbi:hypothetical protein Q7P37_007774 [Cladosporium fusiforme]
MASNQLWSSIAKDSNYTGGSRTFATEREETSSKRKPNTNTGNNTNRPKRGPSPSHVPKTTNSQETVYVLTLLTDTTHQNRMTALRKRYFPPKLNKLGAHLTLFHALPESKLQETIIPTLQSVAANTQPFKVHAAKPFRMKKGIAISVPKGQGGQRAQEVHQALLGSWKDGGWLSEQDRGGMRVHYTIMNKVDEEEIVQKAMSEVEAEWKGDWGDVVGLGLWRYERGFWKWSEGFYFEEGGEKGR